MRLQWGPRDRKRPWADLWLVLVLAAQLLGGLQPATCRHHHHQQRQQHRRDQQRAIVDPAAVSSLGDPSQELDGRLLLLAAASNKSEKSPTSDEAIDRASKQLEAVPAGRPPDPDTPSASRLQQQQPPSLAADGPTPEESMKFPLYMRILATLACLIIFTIGVCGNLLVPLVVIKTKYLRNSTNLFLINLSVADLLVLIVCMPTVLIELHSRPETWLLGEPMCKLSNFVEMLAANGSIFTILAISFERYYAICKPLKAGYKCTRLRATIIICLIWVLSTLLTSPILIMAKSSETIYIDGSLVYNCILETDTYWHKMYVFISMVAFFCLPLIVLMLVYWLIGRRLIRENLAMSTTTSLTTAPTTDAAHHHQAGLATGGGGLHCTSPTCTCDAAQIDRGRRLHNEHPPCCGHCHNPLGSTTRGSSLRASIGQMGGRLRESLKSIPGSLFSSSSSSSSMRRQSYHPISQRRRSQSKQTAYSDDDTCTADATTSATCGSHQGKSIRTAGQVLARASTTSNGHQQRRLLTSKALSLDHHFVARPASGSTVDAADNINNRLQPHDEEENLRSNEASDTGLNEAGAKNGPPISRSLAQRFVRRLFQHLRPSAISDGNKPDDNFPDKQTGKGLGLRAQQPDASAAATAVRISTSPENRANKNRGTNGGLHQGGCELSSDELSSSQAPFIGAPAQSRPRPPQAPIYGKKGPLRGAARFYWAKRFSVSSSSASMQTNCTSLPSESSGAIAEAGMTANGSASQVSPRPIIHCGSRPGSFQKPHRPLIGGTKKCAHFSLSTTDNNSSPSPPICSSSSSSASSAMASETSSSAGSVFGSKTPSPDPMFDQTLVRGGLRGHEAATIAGCFKAKNQYLMARNSSMVVEVDEELEASLTETTGPPAVVQADRARSEMTQCSVTENYCCANIQVENDKQISTTTTTQENPLATEGDCSLLGDGSHQNNRDTSTTETHERAKSKLPIRKGKSLEHKARDNHHYHNFHFNLRRANTRCGTQSTVCAHYENRQQHPPTQNRAGPPYLSEVVVVQDLNKNQRMDSRRQVVVMLAFVVACFFLLFFPYRVFTIWLILSTEDQVQSLGMETYYNLTYFSRILIYLHSAINPIAYNLISTKFRRAFMSILLCRGSSSRRHFTTEHRFMATNAKSMTLVNQETKKKSEVSN